MNRSTFSLRALQVAACFAFSALASCGGGDGGSGSPTDPQDGAVVRIDITPASPSLIVGQQVQLTATLRNASGQAISGETVVWSSADGTRVRVSDTGVITGTGLGSANITAQAGGRIGEVTAVVGTGPASALVKLTPDSAASVGSTRLLSVRVTDAGGSPVRAQTVNWAVAQGNGTLSAPSSVSDVAGVASVSWTIGSAGGTQAVNATAVFASAGVGFSSAVAAGPPDLANSTVAVTLPQLVADGKSSTTVTVQLRDANNVSAATGAGTVGLTVRKGTLSPVTDNHNGTYSAVYTAPTRTGGDTIAATLNGSPLLKVATLNLKAGPVATYIVTGPSSQSITAGSTVGIQATPVDAFGNHATEASGRTVSWSTDAGQLSSTTSVVSFQATVGLTVGTVAGTQLHVTASDAAGITGTGTFTIVAGGASTVTSSVSAAAHSLPADGKSTTTVTVLLKDAFGNAARTGSTVTVSNSIGAPMSKAVETAPGTLQSTLTAGITASSAVTVIARIDGFQVAHTDTIALTPGPAVKCSVTLPTLRPVSGSTQTIILFMLDTYGNPTPAPGHNYLWASSAATFSPTESTTDATGRATAQMTVTAKAGAQGGVTASESGGFPCTSQTFFVQ